MNQNNFLINTVDIKYNDSALPLIASSLKLQAIKKCNRRDETGWCNKTNRRCALLKGIF